MVEAVISKEMIKILSDLKDKRFLSYICEKDDGFSQIYGNIRIVTDKNAIEIVNEVHPLKFFDGIEDISFFEIEEVNPENPFVPFVVTDTEEIKINKTITGIDLINDTINVNNGEYEITFDAAIIFHLDDEILMLARDVWFSELISIAHDDDYERILSINDQIEMWSNEGEDEVTIDRKRIRIC